MRQSHMEVGETAIASYVVTSTRCGLTHQRAPSYHRNTPLQTGRIPNGRYAMRDRTENILVRDARSDAVSPHSALIVACCSGTKRHRATLRARDAALQPGGLTTTWPALVAESTPVARADELYAGRAFSTVRSAAAKHDADMGVLSAGLGFVLGRTAVPSYSLTLADGPDALRACAPVTRLDDWWSALSRSRFAADLIHEVQNRPVTILALSQRYCAMIAETLERLAPDIGRLRLIGLGLKRVVPSSVAPAILPYDARAASALMGGTLGEFAARATAYHLEAWAHRDWDLDRERAHAAAISAAGIARVTPDRRRATDAEIVARIGDRASPPATLRRLRDEGIACGSERFARIMAMGAAV